MVLVPPTGVTIPSVVFAYFCKVELLWLGKLVQAQTPDLDTPFRTSFLRLPRYLTRALHCPPPPHIRHRRAPARTGLLVGSSAGSAAAVEPKQEASYKAVSPSLSTRFNRYYHYYVSRQR